MSTEPSQAASGKPSGPGAESSHSEFPRYDGTSESTSRESGQILPTAFYSLQSGRDYSVTRKGR